MLTTPAIPHMGGISAFAPALGENPRGALPDAGIP